MRGFRGCYRKILAVIRLLYGCCKIGKQVNRVYLQRKEHTSQLCCSPYKEAELCSASYVLFCFFSFFFGAGGGRQCGQLQRVVLLDCVGFR